MSSEIAGSLRTAPALAMPRHHNDQRHARSVFVKPLLAAKQTSAVIAEQENY
jgi:hypothetical protein